MKPRLIIFAVDGMGHNLLGQYHLQHLSLNYNGITDISEFSMSRTVVLWSSFLTGRNMEADVLGSDNQWAFTVDCEDTFLGTFQDPYVIDLPGYNYDVEGHGIIKEMMISLLSEEDIPGGLARYNSTAIDLYLKYRAEFYTALTGGHDLILWYIGATDEIGHLNMGDEETMRRCYAHIEAEVLCRKLAGTSHLMVISDHGMNVVGRYGDHDDNNGYWATTWADLGIPRVTQMRYIIEEKFSC